MSKFVNRPLNQIIDLFNRINQDCVQSGQGAVPLTDVEFYAEQIHNLNGGTDYDRCVEVAEQMASSAYYS